MAVCGTPPNLCVLCLVFTGSLVNLVAGASCREASASRAGLVARLSSIVVCVQFCGRYLTQAPPSCSRLPDIRGIICGILDFCTSVLHVHSLKLRRMAAIGGTSAHSLEHEVRDISGHAASSDAENTALVVPLLAVASSLGCA